MPHDPVQDALQAITQRAAQTMLNRPYYFYGPNGEVLFPDEELKSYVDGMKPTNVLAVVRWELAKMTDEERLNVARLVVMCDPQTDALIGVYLQGDDDSDQQYPGNLPKHIRWLQEPGGQFADAPPLLGKKPLGAARLNAPSKSELIDWLCQYGLVDMVAKTVTELLHTAGSTIGAEGLFYQRVHTIQELRAEATATMLSAD